MGLRLVQDDGARPKQSGAFGRYSLHDAIAVGEESSVHVGLLEGASGFKKPVAFKRLLPRLAGDREAIARLTYEACVVAQIHHPNVVQALDLVETEDESYLVMEYVLGETLGGVIRSGARAPVPVAVAVMGDALRGLDAAHAARGASGQSLAVVHRNVCPANLLVGVDGVTRVIDFGSALSTAGPRGFPREAAANLGYAAPEQMLRQPTDRRADVFSAGVVLWEMLTGKRLFRNAESREAFLRDATRNVLPASAFNHEVPRALDAVVLGAIGFLPEERFQTAGDFAQALENAVAPASRTDVAAYLERKAAATLKRQRTMLAAIDAPSGRISEPPDAEKTELYNKAELYNDATIRFAADDLLAHLSAAVPDRHAAPPFSNIDDLRARLSAIVEQNKLRSRIASSVRRLGSSGGSTIKTSAAIGLLLLAGVRLSLGTPAAPSTTAAKPAAEIARATPELPRPAEAAPVAHRFAAVATPPNIFAEVEDKTAERSEPTGLVRETQPDRSPKKAAARRPAAPAPGRGACDPPFTLDAFGIKRLKLNCL
jgi:serine/threonine-protein kinase